MDQDNDSNDFIQSDNPEILFLDGLKAKAELQGREKPDKFAVIPKDISRYPGFPDVKKMSSEEALTAVNKYWKDWRKKKSKEKARAKWKEQKLLAKCDQNELAGTSLFSNEQRAKFEAKKQKMKEKSKDRAKRRKMILAAALRDEFPDDEDFPLYGPPKNLINYPDFPDVQGIGPNEAKAVIYDYWINWRKTQAEKFFGKKKEKNDKRKQMKFKEDFTPKATVKKPEQERPKIMELLVRSNFGLTIHSTSDRQNPIPEQEFLEIMSQINQAWMEEVDVDSCSLKIEASEWLNNRGIIVCQDEFSKIWIQNHIDDVKINGKSFRAWGKNEKEKEVLDASVVLGKVLDKCPDAFEVINKALVNVGIEGMTRVVEVKQVPEGRLVKLEMERRNVQAIKAKGNRIFAGLSPLEFKFN